MICPYPNCHHEWETPPHVLATKPPGWKPVACPRCKQRLDTPWAIREAKAEPESDVEMERRTRG